jgi:perosamine synthetase
MSDLHAAIGIAQFRRLPEILEKRKKIAERYNEGFKDLDGVELPYVSEHVKHPWFFYPLLVDNRDKIIEYLNSKGIGIRVGWPVPIHKQPAYRDILDGEQRYPVAEEVAERIINLPMYHAMTEEEQNYVIETFKEAVNQFCR